MTKRIPKDDVWMAAEQDATARALADSLAQQETLRQAGDPQRLALDEKARTNLGIELDPNRRTPKPRFFIGIGGEDWVEGRDSPPEERMSIAAE